MNGTLLAVAEPFSVGESNLEAALQQAAAATVNLQPQNVMAAIQGCWPDTFT